MGLHDCCLHVLVGLGRMQVPKYVLVGHNHAIRCIYATSLFPVDRSHGGCGAPHKNATMLPPTRQFQHQPSCAGQIAFGPHAGRHLARDCWIVLAPSAAASHPVRNTVIKLPPATSVTATATVRASLLRRYRLHFHPWRAKQVTELWLSQLSTEPCRPQICVWAMSWTVP